MATNLPQIEEMFHRAMNIRREERASYLDEVCSEDPELRREVDSLIAAYESSQGVLDDNAVTLAMKVLSSEAAASMAGQEVGPYKILELLGQGGMGAVYLAENRRLNKKVAVKFLSSDFVTDNWAKRQLIKEAQAVAMLDHPNICAVYDFEEIGEHSFIVMQYVEGQTLADLIRKDSLDASQVVPLANQIVGALADAHAHGIIHRDIKPRNIMVTPSGQAKVLDFGLAKTTQKSFEDITESASQLSRDGLLVGTVAYMSPEQLRGEKLDYRSDIFSLGTVLYEMVSGKNPFAHKENSKASKSNAEVISAIMTNDPPSLRQSNNCPGDFDRVVTRCLRKDRTERYQSAAELLIDLENLERGIAPPRRIWPYLNARTAGLAAVLLLAVVVGAFIVRSWETNEQTLAVAPIACEGIEQSQCLGPALTQNLVRALSHRKGLRVTTSQVVPSLFGAQAASPEKVGRSLGADTVLYGRIRRGEKGLILTTRLMSVKDDLRVVEEDYSLNPERMSLLAQQLSFDTASNLQLPLNEDDKSLFAAVAAQQNLNADAVTLYLAGRRYWSKRDWENIQKAIDSFVQATEKDPQYAKAWAGLSDCYVLMNTVAYDPTVRNDAMKRAEIAAKQALDIDNNLAEAHNANAAVLMKGHWDWENAEKEFTRALALNPDYSPSHWGYSNLLAITGRFNESISEAEVAKGFDPFSAAANLNYCRALYFARQFDRAYPCYDRLAEEYPDYSSGKYAHAIVFALQGRFGEATQIFEELYKKNKALGGAMLGFTYGVSNRREDAERVLHEMQQLPDLPSQELAIIYLGLNDLDHAIPLFQKAIEEKYPPAQTIFIDPMFDRLRVDPRFGELARGVKLPLPSSAPSPVPTNTSAK